MKEVQNFQFKSNLSILTKLWRTHLATYTQLSMMHDVQYNLRVSQFDIPRDKFKFKVCMYILMCIHMHNTLKIPHSKHCANVFSNNNKFWLSQNGQEHMMISFFIVEGGGFCISVWWPSPLILHQKTITTMPSVVPSTRDRMFECM